MYTIRYALAVLWFMFICFYGTVLSLFFWGNRNLTFYVSRLWRVFALTLCGLEVVFDSEEKLYLHQPCIYVANHQNILDIVVLGSHCPRNTIIVAKKELLYVPFFNLFLLAGRHIVIQRARQTSAISGLTRAAQEIERRKVSVYIFPEGTRNRTKELLLPFKKGAFHMSIRANVPVVPIVCDDLRSFFRKQGVRQGFFEKRRVRVKVLAPISPHQFENEDALAFSRYVRERMLHAIHELNGKV